MVSPEQPMAFQIKVSSSVAKLIYFSHRMLPLTYFNSLILIGFVLVALALTGREARGSETKTESSFD